MLKFVRTKNFKMPGSRQMVDIHVHNDAATGETVQREQWQETVDLPSSHGAEPKKVLVPFTRTYTSSFDEEKGVMKLVEEVESTYGPSEPLQPMTENCRSLCRSRVRSSALLHFH